MSHPKKNILKDPHVASEGDITKLDPENPLTNFTRRQKRPRNEILDKSEDDLVGPTLKEELFDMLTNWKQDQDILLNKLCNEMADLKQQNSKLQTTNEQLQQSLSFISSQYEDMKEKLVNIEQDRKACRNFTNILETKIEDLQRKMKFTVFELKNLPAPVNKIKPETQQDLCNMFQKTCEALGLDIPLSEVKDIYRLRHKTGTSTLVTELTTVVSKNKIINAGKNYNKNNPNSKLSTTTIGLPGPNLPIYLTESLTYRDTKLFAMARETRKSLDYKYCWTNQGRIYLRKTEGSARVVIKNELDLSALKKI